MTFFRVQAGSIIGAVSACIGYGYNYGSVFSENAGVPAEEIHNRRKVSRKRTTRVPCRPQYSRDTLTLHVQIKEHERQTSSSSKTSLSMHQLV